MIVYSWRWSLPLLVLWLAFTLRLYHLDEQSIWWDEGHSIFVATHPIPHIPTLPAMDVHPPAYFIVLHLWLGMAGQSEFALRYLSVLFSLLTVALLWRFARSLAYSNQLLTFKPLTPSPPHPFTPSSSHLLTAPLLASLLAALSPMYMAYAQEVRSYAMITCFSLASTWTLWQFLVAPLATPARPSHKAGSLPATPTNRSIKILPVTGHRSLVNIFRTDLLLLYIVLTAICLYTHYFTIFLLLFHQLSWLAWIFFGSHSSSWKKRAAAWLIVQVGILLLFAPQLLLALRQVTGYTNPNLTPPGLSQFISRSWQAYTVGLTIGSPLVQWGMGAIAGSLVILFLWLLLQKIRQFVNPPPLTSYLPFAFLAGWFFIPLAAYFLVLQRQPSFEPRYLILVTPALFLTLALGLNEVLRVRCQVSGFQSQSSSRAESPLWMGVSRFTFHVSRFTFYALCIILFAVFIVSLHSYYTDETYFKDDSAGVADWLAAETTADDIIYVDVPHPFHYYAGQDQIAAPLHYLFVDIHTAAETLSREAAGRDRLYWVTWRGSDTDPRGVIPFLAQKYGQKLGQRDFRGYRVEWFSLPETTVPFSLPAALSPVNAVFGDVLLLDGIAYGGQPPSGSTLPQGQSGWATLHFTLLRETEVDYKVSLRLRSETGQIVAQDDRELLNDRHFRTSAWPLADPALNQAINVYTLSLAPDTPPGDYQLEGVVYHALPPYPSEGVTGLPSSDGVAAVIGNITVIPEEAKSMVK